MKDYLARKGEKVALRKGYDSDDESTYDVEVVARRMVPVGQPELVTQ
jgi:hypothetical protein